MINQREIKCTYIDVDTEEASERQIKDSVQRWLKGSPESNKWEFKEYLAGQYPSRLTMYWTPTMKVKTSGARARWYVWKKYGQSLCNHIFEADENLGASSSYKTFTVSIKAICEYFCFTRHCISVSDIQESDIEAYETYLANKALTRNYIAECLRNIKKFWTYKTGVKEGLNFDPYPSAVKISLLAKKLGRKNGHTKTLKPQKGLHLLDHAINIINNSKDVLDRFDVYMELKSSSSEPYKLFQRRYDQTVKSFIQEVASLYGAAISVVFSLSAMRKHEANQATYKEAKALADGDVDTLTGRVHKTAGTQTGRKTERKVVKEVQNAIKIIIRLTRPRREETGSKFLLLRLPFHNSIKRGSIPCYELATHSMYRVLDAFAKDAGYEKRSIRPHMFRRFFAMMWAWRFETGDLHYLSKLLYHNGYEFTTAYTEDEDIWSFMPNEMKQLTYDLFEKILIGDKRIVAGFSRTIEQYKKLLQASVTIVTAEQMEVFICSLLERNDYIVMPAGDGYCFMSKSRGKRAKCSKNGELPDYGNRNENLCSLCGNFGVTEDRGQYWQVRYDAHKKTYQSARTKTLKDAAKKGMEICKRMLNDINLWRH